MHLDSTVVLEQQSAYMCTLPRARSAGLQAATCSSQGPNASRARSECSVRRSRLRARTSSGGSRPKWMFIGANGSLTGYGGGLHVKRRLLELEGALLPGSA